MIDCKMESLFAGHELAVILSLVGVKDPEEKV